MSAILKSPPRSAALPIAGETPALRSITTGAVAYPTRGYNAAVETAARAEDLLKELASYLDEGRLEHSKYAAAAAVELAQRYAPELVESAHLAGLLHDNAKGLSDEQLIAEAARLDIEVSDVERRVPALLHGKVGAALLHERFGVDDPEVAQAVADHVTGRPGMGTLSRIMFVADQMAEDREFEGVDDLREMAKKDLEQALFMVARFKLRYIIDKEVPIDPSTVKLYNELCPGERECSDWKD